MKDLFKCTICNGTGFYKGEICICIKGMGVKKGDDFAAIKDLFGDVFKDKKDKP